MKKIALMITGDIPEYMTQEEVNDLPRVLGKFFDHCDIYYHVWDTERSRTVLKDFPKHVSYWKEMRADYDPWEIIVRDNLFQKPWMDASVRQACRCQQHLSQAIAESCLPKNYDWHIRCRWDIVIHRNFVLNDWIKYAEEKNRVVGFGFQVRGIHESRTRPNGMLEYAHMKRIKAKEVFENKPPVVLESIADQTRTMNYQNYLMDFFMIYRPEDFDIDRVFTLLEKRELANVEAGWHQILCQHREHTNVSGYLGMIRILNTDRERIKADLIRKNIPL